MTSPEPLEPKKIPPLGEEEQQLIRGDAGDDAAEKEAHIINSGASIGDIKKKAETREADRAERFRDNFETISIWAIWGIFCIFSVLTIVWFTHLVLPETRHWLTKPELDKLQLIITGGFITGIASSHLKKRLT